MAEVTSPAALPGAPTRARQHVGAFTPPPPLPVDVSAQLFVQLYSKLAAALSVPGTVGNDSGAILSLQVPGLNIDLHMDVEDPATQYAIANALNPTLACSWTLVRGAATVTDVYKAILDGKETPLVELTEAQRRELAAADAYLHDPGGGPTPAYARYLECQLAWLQALDSFEAARATYLNGGEPVPKRLRVALQKAAEVWRTEGHQHDVERALATVAEYEALEPHVFWYRLHHRFREYTRVAHVTSEFQLVDANPPYQQWNDPAGWSAFSYDSRDYYNQPRSGGVGLDDGCCRCCAPPQPTAPAPLLAARAPGDAGEVPIPLGEAEFILKASLRRIEIVRPWMDANVFYSRAWRWSRASVSYGVVVSTGGDIAGRLVPKGVMPVLPTTAILARDIDIFWDDGGRTAAQVRAHLESGRDVRYGPFSLVGAAVDGEHRISIPGPQLIGFISAILPECPNPDPALEWPLTGGRRGTWPA